MKFNTTRGFSKVGLFVIEFDRNLEYSNIGVH